MGDNGAKRSRILAGMTRGNIGWRMRDAAGKDAAGARLLGRFSALAAGLALAAVATSGIGAASAAGASAAPPAATAPKAAGKPANATRPAWATLTPAQQSLLAPLASNWDSMGEVNRRKWIRIADRAQRLDRAEQERLQERMREWVGMTPAQRRLARENFQIHRMLPPERKTQAWDRYQQLPEDRKRQLAESERTPTRPGAVSALPSSRTPAVRPQTPKHPAGSPPSAAAAGTTGHAAGSAPAAAAATADASAPAGALPATPAAVPSPPVAASDASADPSASPAANPATSTGAAISGASSAEAAAATAR